MTLAEQYMKRRNLADAERKLKEAMALLKEAGSPNLANRASALAREVSLQSGVNAGTPY